MNITVYLGANEGNDPFFKEAVRELGAWIGTNGNTLVYGGSKSGLMGELAESVLQAGGKVIGVEPQFFIDAGFVYDEITELITTKDMSERKAKMIELGDAKKEGGIDKETLSTMAVLLSPFAPHVAEELWEELGHTESVFKAGWPKYDENAMKDDEIKVPVQINGKTKAVIEISADASKEEALAAGKEAIADKLTGNVIKEIYVPKKIINIVMK